MRKVEGDSVSGSYLEGQQLLFDWIDELERPTMVCVAGNRLTDVNLEALSTCRSLKRLDISENALSKIDLAPLGNLDDLAHLDISHNRIRQVDFGPLANCKKLRWVYAQQNDFRSVNLAPLFIGSSIRSLVLLSGVRASLDFSDSVPVDMLSDMADLLIQSLYRAIERPDWLDGHVEFEPSPPSLQFLVNCFGWKTVVRSLKSLKLPMRPRPDKMCQRRFLSGLGMLELVGLETGIAAILDVVPQEMNWQDSLDVIYDEVVGLLRKQIRDSGITVDMDVEAMAGKKASVLVPLIIEKRHEETSGILLYRSATGSIDVTPLAKTAYGRRVLSALGYESNLSENEFSKLRRALRDVGVRVEVQ